MCRNLWRKLGDPLGKICKLLGGNGKVRFLSRDLPILTWVYLREALNGLEERLPVAWAFNQRNHLFPNVLLKLLSWNPKRIAARPLTTQRIFPPQL
ncbi:MAG: hypothetical protein A2428_06945 [Bdellovibrionales bacterium RIFOXYC1_FULL_54_43]|nr:MAG: hypothetical protein A2428_06945 [Bdellovibrionales bacterium RIFOXYC1_FULL_54_43]OFZ81169.1 MAG: hypothetical protein A2603_06910 [Bdellovibrionales bacterium RIFOXYD1_FULL_55_31]